LRGNDLEVMRNFYEKVVGLEPMRQVPGVALFRLSEGYSGYTTILVLFGIAGSSGSSGSPPVQTGAGALRFVQEHLRP
jgi:hypothetical protein